MDVSSDLNLNLFREEDLTDTVAVVSPVVNIKSLKKDGLARPLTITTFSKVDATIVVEVSDQLDGSGVPIFREYATDSLTANVTRVHTIDQKFDHMRTTVTPSATLINALNMDVRR